MRLQSFLSVGLAVLLAGPAHSLLAQTVAAAQQGSIPLVIGAGFSDFGLDYGGGRRMVGPSAWVDWNFVRLPGLLSGFGIEAEGHDINYDRPSSLPKMRQDVIEGGAIYTVRHYDKFHPYAKFLAGIGSIDFPDPPNPLYTHDTRTVLSPGGGIEYDAYGHLWVRGDYEYQFWRHIFGPNDLNPNGFTIGVSYHFAPSHRGLRMRIPPPPPPAPPPPTAQPSPSPQGQQ